MGNGIRDSLAVVTSALPNSGVAMGGIGTGGLEIWPDGTFRNPCFLNNRPWAGRKGGQAFSTDVDYAPEAPPFSPEDLFFLARVEVPGKEPELRLLLVGHGLSFVAMGNLSRTYKYAHVPTVQSVSFEAAFPSVRLSYEDESLPAQISSHVWTPYLIHDVEASSVPGFVVDFVVEAAPGTTVSIVAVLSNLAGWDQAEASHSHERCSAGVLMRGGMHKEHPTTGTMALGAFPVRAQSRSVVTGNPYLENLLLSIVRTGTLDGPLHPEWLKREEVSGGFAPRDKAWVQLGETVGATGRSELRFAVGWHFPNHRDRAGKWVGHAYARKFGDAAAVVGHLGTQEPSDLPVQLTSSSIPDKFRVSLMDQLPTLTKCSWLAEDGRFFLWEGLGCCCLNTVDVQHYASMAQASLFPTLEASGLEIVKSGQRPDGQIPHGFPQISTPDDLPEGEFSRWDVNAQFVLAVERHLRWTGSGREFYDASRAAFQRLLELDRYGIGLPYVEGGITYDHWHMKGVVSYLASVFLAACKAMERLARVCGDDQMARVACQQFKKGSEGFLEHLVHEGRVLLFHRRKSDDGVALRVLSSSECGEGCGCSPDTYSVENDLGLHTDALNGDGWARISGAGAILPDELVRSHLGSVFRQNRHPTHGFLSNGTQPDGSFPDEWPFSQWQNPWTGTEYFFAAHCLSMGMDEEAFAVIDNVFDRLTASGMRFNHVECDEHYARPLSIWGAFAAWHGLGFEPLSAAFVESAAGASRSMDTWWVCSTMTGRLVRTQEEDGSSVELKVLSGEAVGASVRPPLGWALASSSIPERIGPGTMARWRLVRT